MRVRALMIKDRYTLVENGKTKGGRRGAANSKGNILTKSQFLDKGSKDTRHKQRIIMTRQGKNTLM